MRHSNGEYAAGLRLKSHFANTSAKRLKKFLGELRMMGQRIQQLLRRRLFQGFQDQVQTVALT